MPRRQFDGPGAMPLPPCNDARRERMVRQAFGAYQQIVPFYFFSSLSASCPSLRRRSRGGLRSNGVRPNGSGQCVSFVLHGARGLHERRPVGK